MPMSIKLTNEEKQKLIKIKQKGPNDTIRTRSHAVLLREKGYTISNTAKAVMRSENFVKNALRLFNENKLDTKFTVSNNNKLSDLNRQEVVEMIKTETPKNQKDFKFRDQFWTMDVLKIIIKKRYGVEYKSENSYYNLFKDADFSFHKPKPKDFRQDPAKLKEFKGALKKSSTTTKIRLSW